MMLRILFVFLLFTISGHTRGQEYLKVYFLDSLVNLKEPPSRFVVFTYKFKSDTVFYSGIPYTIKPPLDFSIHNSAFGFLQFERHEWQSIPSHCLFFVDNYASESPTIYIDRNFDLDFTNDMMVGLDNNRGIEVELRDERSKNVKVRIELNKIIFKDRAQEETVESFANRRTPASINNDLCPARYWMTELRYNYRIAREYEDLALMDFDNSGRFNDFRYDKILISDSIGSKVNDGNNIYRFNYGIDSIINFRGTVFKVIDVDSLGHHMTLQKFKDQNIDSTLTLLKNGAVMPNFEFLSFDNQQISLSQIRPKDKFLLIDFWGIWCKPCLAQTNDLKKLKHNYSEILEILGLAYQGNRQKATEYVKSKGLDWINGFATDRIVSEFQITNFPSYILVDKSGIIMSVNSNLGDIEKLIK